MHDARMAEQGPITPQINMNKARITHSSFNKLFNSRWTNVIKYLLQCKLS